MAWDFRSKRRQILKQQNILETIRDDMDQRFASLKSLLELNEQLQKLPRNQYVIIQQQTVQNDIGQSIKALTMSGISLSDLFTRFGGTLFKAQVLDAQDKINEAESKGRTHNIQLNLDAFSDRRYADMRAQINPESIDEKFRRRAESVLPKNRQNEKYFKGITDLLKVEFEKLRDFSSIMPGVEGRHEQDISEEQEQQEDDVQEQEEEEEEEKEIKGQKQKAEEQESEEQVDEDETTLKGPVLKKQDPRNKKLAVQDTLFTSQDQPFKKIYKDIQNLGYDKEDFRQFYNQFVPAVFGTKKPEGHKKKSKKPEYKDFENFIQQPGTPFQQYLKQKDASNIDSKDLLEYFIILNTQQISLINVPGVFWWKKAVDRAKKYDINDFENVFTKSISDTEQELKKRSQE